MSASHGLSEYGRRSRRCLESPGAAGISIRRADPAITRLGLRGAGVTSGGRGAAPFPFRNRRAACWNWLHKSGFERARPGTLWVPCRKSRTNIGASAPEGCFFAISDYLCNQFWRSQSRLGGSRGFMRVGRLGRQPSECRAARDLPFLRLSPFRDECYSAGGAICKKRSRPWAKRSGGPRSCAAGSCPTLPGGNSK